MNHISEYRIQNFKSLKDIQLKDIGSVNLIVGDNNAGKTSLLESLLFSDNRIELLKNYHRTLCLRDLHIHTAKIYNPRTGEISGIEFPKENYLNFIINDLTNYCQIEYVNKGKKKKNIIKLESLSANELSSKEKKSAVSQQLPGFEAEYWIKFYLNSKLKEIDWLYVDELIDLHKRHIPFITFNAGYKKELIDTYYNQIHNSKKLRKAFVENLKFIIPNIEEVLVSKISDRELLSVSTSEFDEPLPLTRFGDGSVRVLRILLEITKQSNGRLMIDELSNGIHHSKLKYFWKIILRAAKNSNVQIFATTHSLECLQNFVAAIDELSEELNNSDYNCYKLTKVGKDREIKAYKYDFKQFKSLLDSEVEIRGSVNQAK